MACRERAGLECVRVMPSLKAEIIKRIRGVFERALPKRAQSPKSIDRETMAL